MFPGYVFARFDQKYRLPILMLPGVVHVVGAGKEPVPIDTAELESIRAIVAYGYSAQPWAYVHAGQRVSVVRGPLTGAQGVILTFKDECRLVASLTLLQRSVSVEIEREWIEVDYPSARLRAS
jgi:transcription antitermination factor NusG